MRTRKIVDRTVENFPLISRGGRALGLLVQLSTGLWNDVKKSIKQWFALMPEAWAGGSIDLVKYLTQVRKSHGILFGRIRWTTPFAEELLRQSPQVNGRLTTRDVIMATETVSETIKRSLEDRINQFKVTQGGMNCTGLPSEPTCTA